MNHLLLTYELHVESVKHLTQIVDQLLPIQEVDELVGDASFLQADLRELLIDQLVIDVDDEAL